MTNQQTIDLYVNAVELAMQKEGLGNQDKMLLNRFKILLRSGATEDADSELARMGKVKRTTDGLFSEASRSSRLAGSGHCSTCSSSPSTRTFWC